MPNFVYFAIRTNGLGILNKFKLIFHAISTKTGVFLPRTSIQISVYRSVVRNAECRMQNAK